MIKTIVQKLHEDNIRVFYFEKSLIKRGAL